MWQQQQQQNRQQSDKGLEFFKIRPEYYIHLTLVDCLGAKRQGLDSGKNPNDALLIYSMLVNQLEKVVIACGKLDKQKDVKDKDSEYNKELMEFKDSLDKEGEASMVRQAKMADFKLELLMERIFEKEVIEIDLPVN